MYMTEKFLPRIGLGSNEELYGKTDFDLFPPRLAEHFRRDDRSVIDLQKPLLNIIELVFNSQGLPDWFLTNKYPLKSRNGEVVGVIGSVRAYADKDNLSKIGDLKWERDDEIGRAVDYIRNNFRANIAIADLVDISGLNHSCLLYTSPSPRDRTRSRMPSSA